MEKKDLKDLIRFFDQSGLSKLKLNNDGFELELEKDGVVAAPLPVVAPLVDKIDTLNTIASTVEIDGELIKTPMVGTFYASPAPDSPVFAKVGDIINSNQTLCIVEAMKIMNEIEAEYDCKILEILVKDGDPVEFDAPIFRVERV